VRVAYGPDVLCARAVSASPVGGPVEHVDVVLGFASLPAEFSGLRIGLLSDLHFPGRAVALLPHVRNWALAREVDLWAVTGDLVDGKRGMGPARELIAALSAPYGVYAVAGNNDNRVFGPGAPATAALEGMGATVLRNRSVLLRRDRAELPLVGVDDPSRLRDDLAAAMRGVDDHPFKLLLAHSPGVVFRAAAAGASLVLSGHTHGGQIRLPRIGALAARTRQRGCGRKMAAGLFSVDDTAVYVSRGLGTSLLPVRILCPPEVTTITLLREEPA